MLEYKITCGVHQEEFTHTVNVLLAQGWVFHGDTKVVLNGSGHVKMYQAFTREKRNFS